MTRLVLLGCLLLGCASFPRRSAPPLPAPAGAEQLVGAGGVRLYASVEGEASRGVVWFVLGPEISSSPPYPRLTAALHEAGFATAVFHPRGTGYSDGLRGDLHDYALFLADHRQFLDALVARFPARPLFLWGHSAGAAFALELAATSGAPLAGVVVVNPAYKLLSSEGMGPSFGDYLVYAMNLVFRPSALTVDLNSRPSAAKDPEDRAEAEAMQRDPLVVRYFSMRYLAAQRQVMDRCAKNAAAVKVPFLLVQGARDALVDPRGNDELLAAVPGADKRRLIAADGAHGSSSVETQVQPLVEWLSARAR